jgi:hypothetical protein
MGRGLRDVTDPVVPYRLVDVAGAEVDVVTEFLRELRARG